GGIILDRFWPYAVEAESWRSHPPGESLLADHDSFGSPKEPGKLGRCLAYARHRCEQEVGLTTTELPLSGVASSDSFLEFASHLLTRYLDFHSAHNSALAEYRLANRIRSQT